MTAVTNVKSILKNIKFNKAVVVFDLNSHLSRVLTEAYKSVIPDVDFIDFDKADLESLRKQLYALSKDDLVILVQSNSFRISSYRIRLDLTNRGVFVIDHARLQYIRPEEYDTYINSLGFVDDGQAERLSSLLSSAKQMTVVSSDNSKLVYKGPFEIAKSNVGDLSKARGSYFPVGELFTELVNLDGVSGECLVLGIPVAHRTTFVKPFKMFIKDGCVVKHEGSKEFVDLIELVKTENPDGKIWLREIGFGLNKFISKEHPLYDITSCERMFGFHFSLGLKHGVFRKKLSVNQRFHIDCFVDVKEIFIDENKVFPF